MRAGGAIHESFDRPERLESGSPRGFGLTFAALFALFALAPLLSGGGVRWIALAFAAVWLALAVLAPTLLRPLSRVWMRFGLLLHKIVNPVVMAAIFFVVMTPAGLIMRWLGRDPLRLALDRSASSYWIERRPPGPAPETMRNQF
jgi:Saxitoxin biosynthesis operon protein SxtJ